MTPLQLGARSHKAQWLKSLKEIGLKPLLIILEQTTRSDWQECERRWISYFKSIPNYPSLTNGTLGGDGMSKGMKFRGDAKFIVKRHTVEQPQDDSYRIIPLTQMQNALVSSHRYEELMQWNWSATWCQNTRSYYATRTVRDGHNEARKMHTYIMGNPGTDVDHINKNTLDNRDENLRICTHTQNLANRGKQRNNTSGYKGVQIHNNGTKWCSRIRIKGADVWLGAYDTAIEAARKYDMAALHMWGEFAHTNFPNYEYTKEEISNALNKVVPAIRGCSGYRGVRRCGKTRWMASIIHKGKSYYLGCWKNAEEAAKQYDMKRIELIGDDAMLNFPRSNYD